MGKIINLVILYANELEVFDYARKLCKQTIVNELDLVIVVNKPGAMHSDVFTSTLKELPISVYVYYPNSNLGYLNGAIYGYS